MSESAAEDEKWTAETLLYQPYMLCLAFVINMYICRIILNAPNNIPPCPTPPYPIFGHLPFLRKGMREQMNEWSKMSGAIFSLYFGPRLVVILNSYEAIYDGFVRHADTLSDRPPSLAADAADEEPNRGILTSSGSLWKEQRTTALHIFGSFGMGKNMLAVKVREEVATYIAALRELSGRPTDARALTRSATANVICSIIFGKRMEYDDFYLIQLLYMLSEQVRLTTSSSLFTVFPWLRHLPGDFFNAKRRISNYRNILRHFCYRYIHKTQGEYDENNIDNYIAAYLCEMKKMKQEGQPTTLDEDNLARSLLHLFVAGTDTTSSTMQWFMLYMLTCPDIQEKVFAEIRDVVGTERAITLQDRTSLHYTNAVIMETQRLASTTPLGLAHYATEDTVIKDYLIPAGSTVLANLDALLLSKEIWTQPMTFRPERFLDDRGKLIQHDQFLPFSIGRRQCLGESLARMELFLFLTSLVQRFELLPGMPGEIPSREPQAGLAGHPQPFTLRFMVRQKQERGQ